MKNRTYWPLMYFDGFAGTGQIEDSSSDERGIIEGAARRILDIRTPRPFDMYYFVELESSKKRQLEDMIATEYSGIKNIFVEKADCNDKLVRLSEFLKSPKGNMYKVLAFIDPCGMELNWRSLEILKNLSIDLWILVPTGVGANRLLKRNGDISEAWISRLEKFLGVTKTSIMEIFYQQYEVQTLFGKQDVIKKEENSIEKIHILYKTRLKTIFTFVSDSFVMRNSTNSIMFHFFMATNNKTALKIANDIIKPKYKI